MAVLTDAQRQAVRNAIMELSKAELLGIDKPALRAAVDATDSWINTNAASYNSALPLPARTVLSARQKARLFLAVALRRFEVA